MGKNEVTDFRLSDSHPIYGLTLGTINGVREYVEGHAVELGIRHDGRLVIRAWTEGGYNGVDIDLMDLLEWVRSGHK